MSWCEGEGLDEAEDEEVRPLVKLQVVELRLLNIGPVAQAQRAMGGDAEVGRDHLSHRRGVERCGEDHVVVVVASREDLVVGLAETGRELQSHQGHLQLVAD